MAIKAPNYQDLFERPWVERAIGAAAATVLAAGVTAVATFGSVEIAPMLAAPTYGNHAPTVSRTAGGTTFTPVSFLDAAPAARGSGAATRGRSAGTTSGRAPLRATVTGQPALPTLTAEVPRGTTGDVNTATPPPPSVDDPHVRDTSQPGVYVGASLGDALVAVAADPNGAGATTGDTTVGSQPAEPTSDGVTVNIAPGGDLAPIVVTIP